MNATQTRATSPDVDCCKRAHKNASGHQRIIP